DLIRHGPRGYVDGGLLAGRLRAGVLQAVDRGVVAVPVIAHLRFPHGLAHRLGGLGDGVGPKIDWVAHRSASIEPAMSLPRPEAPGWPRPGNRTTAGSPGESSSPRP